MANPTHLQLLRQDPEAWNEWRLENPDIRPDFIGANLNGIDLSEMKRTIADLVNANLLDAEVLDTNLLGAHLERLDLSHSDFSGTDLRDVNLDGANLSYSDLSGAKLSGASLINTDLSNAILMEARLGHTNFTSANLSDANCAGADFSAAAFTDTFLRGANLSGADLSKAKLSRTNLTSANLARVDLRGAEWNRVILSGTIFGDVDLSETKGLDTSEHRGPSVVGIDTLYKSQGEIPENFLRNAGALEEMIELCRSIRTGPPVQWHSCFISYSTKDEDFARRLHFQMRQANMRVWYASEDLKGGRKLHEQLFDAIQIHDRLLLVLSKDSIKSEWVMTEIRKAREVERRENRRKLFPVRLADFDTLRNWTCFDADTGKDLAVEVREYFIPDFSDWKNHDAFEKAFAKLQADLKAETKTV